MGTMPGNAIPARKEIRRRTNMKRNVQNLYSVKAEEMSTRDLIIELDHIGLYITRSLSDIGQYCENFRDPPANMMMSDVDKFRDQCVNKIDNAITDNPVGLTSHLVRLLEVTDVLKSRFDVEY
jgi:hypothetical protein